MKFFKPYINIKDFLYRFTIIQIGNFHIRIHKIVDKDRSTLLHCHPFNYLSIILKGGYNESVLCNQTKKLNVVKHGFLSLIHRTHNVFHRIDKLDGNTYTLFIAYGKYYWKAINMESDSSDDGIYERIINDKRVWSKKEAGIWYIGNVDKPKSELETRHSIHQAQLPL